MARPTNLPVTIVTRHGNRNSAELQWRNGRVGGDQSDELWMQLNPGQISTSEDEQAANPDNFWGWGSGNVWERVYSATVGQQQAPEMVPSASRGR